MATHVHVGGESRADRSAVMQAVAAAWQRLGELPAALTPQEWTWGLMVLLSACAAALLAWLVYRQLFGRPFVRDRPPPGHAVADGHAAKPEGRMRSWINQIVHRPPPGVRRIRKRDRLMNAAKRVMRRLRKSKPSVSVHPKEPTQMLLEETAMAGDSEANRNLPTEIHMTLRSIRVFGHFPEPVFLSLYKSIETIKLRKGEWLFGAGQHEICMYIVARGHLNLYTVQEDRQLSLLNLLGPGDNLTSLLELVDALTGNTVHARGVSAEAVEDATTVIKIPLEAFHAVIQSHPATLKQIVKAITARLQRVTFRALYRFLGLTNELIAVSPHDAPAHPYDATEATLEDPATRTLVKQRACSELASKLQLKDVGPILEASTVAFAATDEVLVEQRDPHVDLIFVLSGKLQALVQAEAANGYVKFFEILPHMMTGELNILSGVPSFFGVVAAQETVFLRVDGGKLSKLMESRPEVVAALAQVTLSRLSPLIRQIDFALDWNHVPSGQAVYRQGEDSKYMYIVLNGRLRAVHEDKGQKKRILHEYGHNEIVGELGVLTGQPRDSTVLAVRDSELSRLPKGLFLRIKDQCPQVLSHLIARANKRWLQMDRTSGQHETGHGNLATVALLPASADVPLAAFAQALGGVLQLKGPCAVLSAQSVTATTGIAPNNPQRYQDLDLIAWLAEQEFENSIVLYEADYELTPWTKRCIKQADCILVVGLGAAEPVVSLVEKQLEELASKAQKGLVLLHSMDTKMPKGTARWLNMRTWCSMHHHIKVDDTILKARHLQTVSDPLPRSPSETAGLCRLARYLTGTSVGLVLGGGGARGISQLGVIRAMESHDVAIDMVGGTSIGAFVAGLYGEEMGVTGTPMGSRVRAFGKKMGSIVAKLWDLTIPITSMFNGRGFNRGLIDVFEERCIEDLWIPFFAISTDISVSEMRVHQHGSLWRYCRASMSLFSYLPPICDPVDGHLLLDGGYTNILPVDVMRMRGAGTIIAVDVGGREDSDLTNYGDELSGWWLLYKRWNPFTSKVKIPDQNDIYSRLAFISSMMQMEELYNQTEQNFILITPDVQKYGVLQWASHDEIEEAGFKAALSVVEKHFSNKEPPFFLPSQSQTPPMSPILTKGGAAGDQQQVFQFEAIKTASAHRRSASTSAFPRHTSALLTSSPRRATIESLLVPQPPSAKKRLFDIGGNTSD